MALKTPLAKGVEHPHESKASDFPAVGPTGKGGEPDKNKLAKCVEWPRHAEDGGSDGKPVPMPEKRGAEVAKSFPTKKCAAMSSPGKASHSLDMKTGELSVDGKKVGGGY